MRNGMTPKKFGLQLGSIPFQYCRSVGTTLFAHYRSCLGDCPTTRLCLHPTLLVICICYK